MNFVCVCWWFTKHLSRQAFLLWEIARGNPRNTLDHSLMGNLHQGRSSSSAGMSTSGAFHRYSVRMSTRCDNDPLGRLIFWGSKRIQCQQLVEAFAWIPWKIDVWLFSTLDHWKNIPFLRGIQKVGTTQLPESLQKLPCDPANRPPQTRPCPEVSKVTNCLEKNPNTLWDGTLRRRVS